MSDKVLTLILRVRDETKLALEALNKKITDLERTARTSGDGLKNVGEKAQAGAKGLKDYSDTVNEAQQRNAALRRSLRDIGLALAGLGLGRMIKDFADVAARTEVLGGVLRVVAVNGGVTAREIDRIDREVQKLGITASASREALSGFIQAGLDVSKAAPLARAAQDLAVVAGKNSSDLFQNILINIQQLDQQGLRYNGVVLDMDSVTDKFARSLGKSSDELTKAQKQQAVLNGVLEKATQVSGVYEASLTMVGKQVQSLARYQQEAAVSIGNNLLPTYLLLVEQFTLFLKQSKLVTDDFNQQGDGAQKLADNLRPVVVLIRELALFVVENIDLISVLLLGYLGLRVVASVFGTIKLALAPVLEGITFLAGTSFPALGAAIAAWATRVLTVMRGLTIASLFTPLGLALTAIAAAVGFAVFKWNQYKKAKEDATSGVNLNADASGIQQQLTTRLNELLDLQDKLKDAEAKKRGAEKSGNAEAIKEATENLAKGKQREEQLKKQIDLLKQAGLVKGVDVDSTEQQAKVNALRRQVERDVEAVRTKLKELGLDAKEAMQGIDVSSGFSKGMAQTKEVLENFRKEVKDSDGQIVVSFGQAQLAVERFVQSARSFPEITLALQLLREEGGKLVGANLGDVLDTKELERQTAGLKDVDEGLKAYLQSIKESAATAQLMLSLADDSRKFVSGVSEALAEFGQFAQVAANGFVTFRNGAQLIAQDNLAATRIGIRATEEAMAKAVNRYQVENQAIATTAERRRTFAQQDSQIGRAAASVLVAIDRDANKARLDNAKTLYDDLRKLRDEATNGLKSALQEIQRVDEQITASRKSKDEQLFSLKLAGLTEEQKQVEITAKLEKLKADEQSALLTGNLKKAQEINAERIKLIEAQVNSAKTDEERRKVGEQIEESRNKEVEILERVRAKAQQLVKAQADQMNSLTEAINQLGGTFQQLSTKGEVKLRVDRSQFDQLVKDAASGINSALFVNVDQASLDAVRESVQRTLQGITLNLTADGRLPARATGGPISGPGTGTSDSILMWGSNGEYMMKTAAHQFYGTDFMNRLNNMELPRYLPGYAEGGALGDSQKLDEVAIKLDIGGRKVKGIRGSRQAAKELATALTELQRGVLS